MKKVVVLILFSASLFADEIDLSFKALFINASDFVKTIICMLGFFSILSWAIFIAKTISCILALFTIKQQLKSLKNYQSLENKSLLNYFSKQIMFEINNEMENSAYKEADKRIKIRIELLLTSIVASYKKGISLLASIGALSPFIGLLGTVWGIMHSFIGIANSNNTSLNIVAPGIAEALFATAIGLAVAIPAVFFYNFLNKTVANVAIQLNELASFIYILNDRNINVFSKK